MKIEQGYCSPNAKDNGPTCLSKNSLKILIDTYNKSKKYNKDRIKYYDNNTQLELFKKLDNRMKKLTKGSGKYWFWPDIINKLTPINFDAIKKIQKLELRPEYPLSWIKKNNTWLSNYDIDHIMFQYNDNKKFKYRYIGTFSIDFALKNKNNQCLYSDFCNVNILNDFLKKNILYIGFITNLDKHDEPGSHWTSTFINLNKDSKSYGAYYYDSVSSKIPKYIYDFLLEIKKQANNIYPNIKFNIKYNTNQHQFFNTECGMFSMIYQIRWINKLFNNKDTTFKQIVDNKDLNDQQANNLRSTIYRPNIKQL